MNRPCLKIASTCHTCPMTQREALMVTWGLDETARCSQGPIYQLYTPRLQTGSVLNTAQTLSLNSFNTHFNAIKLSKLNTVNREDECFLICHINSKEKKRRKHRRLVYLCTCKCTHWVYWSSGAVNRRILSWYTKQLLSDVKIIKILKLTEQHSLML